MNQDELGVRIGRSMRVVRLRNGLTQAQVAQWMETTQGTVSKFEQGRRIPWASQLWEFCQRTNTSIDSVVYGYVDHWHDCDIEASQDGALDSPVLQIPEN